MRCRADIERLAVPDPERELGYVMQTLRLVRQELAGRVPLIGFAGSPWTLATYMVEGGSTTDFRRIKGMMFEDPEALHALLGTLADSVSVYLNAQVAAGAQALMVFDTWGGVLTPRDLQGLFAAVPGADHSGSSCASPTSASVPVILFTKGGGMWLEQLAETGCDALGVDWTVDLADARRRVGDRVALQGNMDPSALYASPERVRAEVATVLESFGHGSGHVFNLGHGIHPPSTPSTSAPASTPSAS